MDESLSHRILQREPTRHFTPEEATRTLPLVKQIVEDIMIAGKAMRELSVTMKGNVEGNQEFEKLFVEMKRLVAEMDEIGCEFKDWNFEIGLVDFPSFINGEEVYLCWRANEPDVLFFHATNESYSDRRPISMETEKA